MYCRIAGAAAFVQPYPSVSGKQIQLSFVEVGESHFLSFSEHSQAESSKSKSNLT